MPELFDNLEQHQHTGTDSQRVSFRNLRGVSDTKVNYDPPSINSGSAVTQNFTVQGARFKDFVLVSAPYSLQGVQVTGAVSAANVVTLSLFNGSTNIINLSQGTSWIIKLVKSN